jgi:hypothetical protein
MGAEDLIACNLCDASDARAIVWMRKLFAFTAVQRCGFTGKCFGIRAAALPNAQSG